jgi:uncharacterized protein YidB (DUF937 family)
MGLFFEMLNAINNPNQQGNVDQLSTIVNSVQQLGANRGVDASTLQTVLSTIGEYIRPALSQQNVTTGSQPLNNLVSQFTDTQADAGALPSFLTPQLQQQIVQGVSQRTGLNPTTLEALVPGLLPAAIGFLNMGAHTSGDRGANPILNAFLDGDTDLGHVLKFSNRFLNPPS